MSPAFDAAIGGETRELDTAFARATRCERTAPGQYRALVDGTWSMDRGPNGGYLAALLLDGLLRELELPAQRVRSYHVRFLGAAKPGLAALRTRIERRGRSMTWLCGELEQAGHACTVASLATSNERAALEYPALAPPSELPAPERVPQLALPVMPSIARYYDYRSLYATPAAASGDRVGGFVRLREAQPIDAIVLAALCDAWFPASYARDARPISGSTVDLTLHYRNHAALAALAPDAYLYCVFRSRYAAEGFVDEDGEIWTRDGTLLVQSRQLRLATLAG